MEISKKKVLVNMTFNASKPTQICSYINQNFNVICH